MMLFPISPWKFVILAQTDQADPEKLTKPKKRMTVQEAERRAVAQLAHDQAVAEDEEKQNAEREIRLKHTMELNKFKNPVQEAVRVKKELKPMPERPKKSIYDVPKLIPKSEVLQRTVRKKRTEAKAKETNKQPEAALPTSIADLVRRRQKSGCKSEKRAAEVLVNMIFRAPTGILKHAMYRQQTTLHEILLAHGKRPEKYQFTFEGHKISRDVTVKELQNAMPKPGAVQLQWEKVIALKIHIGSDAFEVQMPEATTIMGLLEDLCTNGLVDSLDGLSCQSLEGEDYEPQLTLANLARQIRSGSPISLRVTSGVAWDSDGE